MESAWNLKPLYSSLKDKQINRDIQKSQKKINSFCKKWREDTTYTKDPKRLRLALDEYENLFSTTGVCEKPLYYLILRNNLDQENAEVKGLLNKVHGLAMKLDNELQFFELSISKIPQSKQDSFLNDSSLKKYRHFLEELFKKAKYLLSEKEEQVFNITSKTSYGNWADMVSELLNKQSVKVTNEQGEEKKITYNEVSKYLNSTNKEVRDFASKRFNEINKRFAEIAEFEINSILEYKKVTDEYRGIPRPDLTRHISDDIDTEVVDSLINVVEKNFDISKHYYKKKAKLLGLEKLGYHERNVPLGQISKEYEYKDAIGLVKRTFKNLDPDFHKTVTSFEKNNQIDIFPRKGKSGGAFCISVNKNLPTYILLNHNNKLNDVLTIAHESGHGIHTEFSNTQNSLSNDYPTSLAEVASTFFEDFVLEEILKGADDKTKRQILIQKIDSDVSSIFRQVAFYKFERELHKTFRKKGYLTQEQISDIFCNNMESYLGDAVSKDESMKYGWVYWGHMRRFFYVYSYASGLLISKALQSMVKEDPKKITLVKEFLSSGSTKSPKQLFGDLGIDITEESFWHKGLEETKTLVAEV